MRQIAAVYRNQAIACAFAQAAGFRQSPYRWVSCDTQRQYVQRFTNTEFAGAQACISAKRVRSSV